jgi:hypothetical protein
MKHIKESNMTDQVQDQDVELDDEIEEAHDPKNAEAQSIDSVAKAAAVTKQAPLVRVTKEIQRQAI